MGISPGVVEVRLRSTEAKNTRGGNLPARAPNSDSHGNPPVMVCVGNSNQRKTFMPSKNLIADRPEQVGLDSAKVDALFQRAEREVREGLLPAVQIAVARNGKIGAMRTFGRARQGGSEKPATDETLFTIFSCTKAIMSAAAWILIGEGKLKENERVADIVPEFGTNGKDQITVQQVLLHIAGFPNAPYPQDEWLDRSKRLQRFSKWR